jgi:hypothetical protein
MSAKTKTKPAGARRPRAKRPADKACGGYQVARAAALANFRGKAPWPDACGEVLLGLYILCYVDAYEAEPRELWGSKDAQAAQRMLHGFARRRGDVLSKRDRDDRPGYVRYLRWAFLHEKRAKAADPGRLPLGYTALTSNAMIDRWIAEEGA